MQLFVKSLAGNTLALEVNSATTVDNVKTMIAAREGIDSSLQCLSFAGKSLQDAQAISAYGVQDNSTLHLNAELLGGGKKRKKKTYTTPKKIKHKRKKVKMAILKFYKVDELARSPVSVVNVPPPPVVLVSSWLGTLTVNTVASVI
ncbi:unnamed protein product [Absidia cylindrospora]